MIAPTLLVGLGGTGSKIVCRVSKMVTEEQRKHIGFAVFDTDINELREIQEANPFIRTIQTSTKLTVSRSWRNWFEDCMPRVKNGNGRAAQTYRICRI